MEKEEIIKMQEIIEDLKEKLEDAQDKITTLETEKDMLIEKLDKQKQYCEELEKSIINTYNLIG